MSLQPFAGITAGGLLATVSYTPATNQTYNQGTSMAPLDPVNLVIAVPVPASGRFYVDVGIDWGLFGTVGYAATTDLFLGIALHGSGGATLMAPIQSVGGLSISVALTGTFGIGARTPMHRFLVTGQAPGSTVTLDLVGGISGTANILGQFYAGPTAAVTTDPVTPTLIMAFAA